MDTSFTHSYLLAGAPTALRYDQQLITTLAKLHTCYAPTARRDPEVSSTAALWMRRGVRQVGSVPASQMPHKQLCRKPSRPAASPQAVPPKASGTIYGTFKSMLVGNTVRQLNRDVSQRIWTAGTPPTAGRV